MHPIRLLSAVTALVALVVGPLWSIGTPTSTGTCTSAKSTCTISVTASNGDALIAAVVTQSQTAGSVTMVWGAVTLAQDVGTASNSPGCWVFSTPNVTGATSNLVVTVGGSNISIAASSWKVSGLATSAILDKNTKATGTSATPDSGSTATTAQAAELLFGAIGMTGGTIGGTWANSFTAGDETTISAVRTLGTGYLVVSSTQTAQAKKTSTTNAAWAACIATYKGAGTAFTGSALDSSLILNLTPVGLGTHFGSAADSSYSTDRSSGLGTHFGTSSDSILVPVSPQVQVTGRVISSRESSPSNVSATGLGAHVGTVSDSGLTNGARSSAVGAHFGSATEAVLPSTDLSSSLGSHIASSRDTSTPFNSVSSLGTHFGNAVDAVRISDSGSSLGSHIVSAAENNNVSDTPFRHGSLFATARDVTTASDVPARLLHGVVSAVDTLLSADLIVGAGSHFALSSDGIPIKFLTEAVMGGGMIAFTIAVSEFVLSSTNTSGSAAHLATSSDAGLLSFTSSTAAAFMRSIADSGSGLISDLVSGSKAMSRSVSDVFLTGLSGTSLGAHFVNPAESLLLSEVYTHTKSLNVFTSELLSPGARDTNLAFRWGTRFVFVYPFISRDFMTLSLPRVFPTASQQRAFVALDTIRTFITTLEQRLFIYSVP